MTWQRLTSPQEIPRFIDAAAALHRSILDRLTPDQRPWFYDGWLRRFNRSTAYALFDDDRPIALVTVPPSSSIHELRWRMRTLACADDLDAPIELPDDVDLERSFVMPTEDVDAPAPAIRNATSRVVQVGYAMNADAIRAAEPSPWLVREARVDERSRLVELMEREYQTTDDPPSDMSSHEEELRQVLEHGAGWAFVVARTDNGSMIGVVSYVPMHVPLAEAPGALVADLAVDANHRRRGVALAMQSHGFRRLREAGVPVIFGNIDPRNEASRAQAEALGRRPLYRAVRYRPAS